MSPAHTHGSRFFVDPRFYYHAFEECEVTYAEDQDPNHAQHGKDPFVAVRLSIKMEGLSQVSHFGIEASLNCDRVL